MVASRDGAQARRGRSHTWWRANTARPRTGTGRRVQGGAGSERGRRPTVGGGGGLGKGLTGEVACELEEGAWRRRSSKSTRSSCCWPTLRSDDDSMMGGTVALRWWGG